MNESHKLEITDYQPCAWIRQEGRNYVAPDDGTVDLLFGNLALSVKASQAATITTPIRGFASDVPDVRVLPGGGWSLGGDRGLGVMQTGSLYVYSGSPQRVRIVMRVAAGTAQPSVSVQDATAAPIALTSSPGIVEFNVALQTGLTSLRISSGSSSASPNGGLELTGVTVVNPN